MENLLEFYQNLPSFVSPVIFSIGAFQLRWYSLGYIVTFIVAGEVIKWRIRHKENTFPITALDVYDAYFYTLLGVILGGRLGYLIFYDFNFLQNYPMQAFLPFKIDENGWTFTGISGMSYHGGLIGFIVAFYVFIRRKQFSFFKVLDFFMPAIPLGYTFGRLGNFMNGELYGRVTEVFWGMYFINPNTQLPFDTLRHPSQLYEAAIEGIGVFAVLWTVRNYKLPTGTLSGLYLVCYGAGRFIAEFFREPDEFFKDPGELVGTVWGFMTMGQVLCLVMVLCGGFILYWARTVQKPATS
ncbi:prolipoprotein diacylglyceryl transferase [Spirochaetota bacterium]|nr:prolipoprotein diacylglyceryl transferase [Spirochaetota bacterium]